MAVKIIEKKIKIFKCTNKNNNLKCKALQLYALEASCTKQMDKTLKKINNDKIS